MSPEYFAPHTYALMRVVFGFLFIFHGLQKMFGLLDGRAVELASLRGVAGVIELVCGGLVMAGLLTRPAAFLASGQMAVAYFLVHHPEGLWPIQNRGELAALYCFAFLYIAARGGGIWSVDAARGAS
jgi:putative oxidoreductase